MKPPGNPLNGRVVLPAFFKMFEFPVDNAALKEQFDPDLPNSPALWAVLKGSYTGKAVVDDQHKPSQCVVRTDAALTYFAHQIDQAFLDEAITHFRKVGPVWLVWPHRTSLQPPAVAQAEIIQRLEFYDLDPHSQTLSQLRSQLRDGFAIQAINRQLLERCAWRAAMEFYAGSLGNFLEHGIGLCMMRGNKIIVEAYASSLGKTRAEIGAITRVAYRGRGYAPIACAYLLELCEQRGYRGYWSCDANNKASIRVAQKLGFQQERAYQIYRYDSLT